MQVAVLEKFKSGLQEREKANKDKKRKPRDTPD